MVGMLRGIIRSASAVSPRWVNALPRIRAFSRQEKEKSCSYVVCQTFERAG